MYAANDEQNHLSTLHKIRENTGFHPPAFSRIRTKSMILSLYGKITVSENPYSPIFYAVQDILKNLKVKQNHHIILTWGK